MMEAKSNKELIDSARNLNKPMRDGKYPELSWLRRELADRLEAAEKQIAEKEAEIWRLRKIAAHVPGSVYIKAKEDAGYGEAVRVKEERGEK